MVSVITVIFSALRDRSGSKAMLRSTKLRIITLVSRQTHPTGKLQQGSFASELSLSGTPYIYSVLLYLPELHTYHSISPDAVALLKPCFLRRLLHLPSPVSPRGSSTLSSASWSCLLPPSHQTIDLAGHPCIRQYIRAIPCFR